MTIEQVFPEDQPGIDMPVDVQESIYTTPTQASERMARFGRYNAWRYAANAEWLGGIAVNIAATEAPSAVRWGAALLVGVGVAALENQQTDYAARKMQETYETSDTRPIENPTLVREAFSLGASMYQGAGASVEINDAIGLPNTRRRRRIQALGYATAVSVWASPPANAAGHEIFEQVTDHPIRTALVTLVGSVVGKLVVVDGIKNLREKLEVKQKN